MYRNKKFIFCSICNSNIKLKLIIGTVILVFFTGYHGYTHPNKNKLINIQELLLLTNLTILYASSYHSNSELFSTVSNIMISLALFQFCTIILYHFLTYTCQCDVMGVIKTIKQKLLSKKRSDDQNRFVELLNIPECTYRYNEYQDGLVTDDFVQQ